MTLELNTSSKAINWIAKQAKFGNREDDGIVYEFTGRLPHVMAAEVYEFSKGSSLIEETIYERDGEARVKVTTIRIVQGAMKSTFCNVHARISVMDYALTAFAMQ